MKGKEKTHSDLLRKHVDYVRTTLGHVATHKVKKNWKDTATVANVGYGMKGGLLAKMSRYLDGLVKAIGGMIVVGLAKVAVALDGTVPWDGMVECDAMSCTVWTSKKKSSVEGHDASTAWDGKDA